jgi:hypothetical protein
MSLEVEIPKSTTNEAANPAARDAMLSQPNPASLFDAQYVFCSLSTHESMYNYEVISEFDGWGDYLHCITYCTQLVLQTLCL